MQFDIDRILRETFVARAEYHPSIGSTNDRAAECAAQSAGELPLLVLADQQTAGRGRGANRWWTGPGALAFSLLLDGRTVAVGGNRSPLVALAAAVAVVDAVAPLLPEHPLGIHWPNDVMVGRRKLAGILIEVLPDGRHVVGIGLNTNNTLADAPAELQSRAVTLRDLGRHDLRSDGDTHRPAAAIRAGVRPIGLPAAGRRRPGRRALFAARPDVDAPMGQTLRLPAAAGE